MTVESDPTAEERADRIIAFVRNYSVSPNAHWPPPGIVQPVLAEIRAAVLAERERVIRILEKLTGHAENENPWMAGLAAAIREEPTDD